MVPPVVESGSKVKVTIASAGRGAGRAFFASAGQGKEIRMSRGSGRGLPAWLITATLCLGALPAPAHQRPAAEAGGALSTAEIMDTFTKASTGNVADAVDEAT